MPVKNYSRTVLFLFSFILLVSCAGKEKKTAKSGQPSRLPLTANNASTAPADFDPPYKEKDVALNSRPDPGAVKAGETIYIRQCKSCHLLTNEKLVGPGWKDITRKRSYAWLKNMMRYTALMLANDPEAKRQLEIYQVTMPDQRLSPEMALQLLEFMRQNDR